MKKNIIGLETNQTKLLAKELNYLLANYQIFYINERGFHWNIGGDKFFELHVKFEEMYNDALLKIDEIAERILTPGYSPFHSFTEYLKNSSIKESSNVSDGKKAIEHILSGLKTLIETERELLTLSARADDEGNKFPYE